MSTFITGISGFVGLALAEHLLARGDDVVGFDRSPLPDTAARAFEALPGRFAMTVGDVRDGDALRNAMQRHRPRQLVTLAAITADAARERATPGAIFEVNVGGALAALSAAADAGIARVVHASSGSVYGASGKRAGTLREDFTPLAPEGLYGISKQAAEAAMLRLAALRDVDLVCGRLGTCFGPWEADTGVRDTPSAPLQIVRLAERGEPARLPRDSTRDWLYVRDAAAGLCALLDHAHLPHPVYNVAAGFVGQLSDWCRATQAVHAGFEWCVVDSGANGNGNGNGSDGDGDGGTQRRDAGDDRAPNIDCYASYDRAPMDIARLQADTGFAPRFDLDAAATDFFDWRGRHA